MLLAAFNLKYTSCLIEQHRKKDGKLFSVSSDANMKCKNSSTHNEIENNSWKIKIKL